MSRRSPGNDEVESERLLSEKEGETIQMNTAVEPNDSTEPHPTIAEMKKGTDENANAANKKDDDDDDEEETVDYQAETVTTILKPVSITMIMVIWAVKTITLPAATAATSFYMAYDENDSQSTGQRFLGSIVNALIMLAAILVTTVAFVILYKFRCLKVIYGWLITSSLMMLGMFGGFFFFYLLDAYNSAFDWISMAVLLWNFSTVGIVSIFWHAPTKVNQGYLIIISALLAIFFTRFPEWTTFAVLAIIAIYDIVAVLSPCGPLKYLVETAQQRQEPIPALLYNASVYIFMADQVEEPQKKRKKGVKLGLGDFIFYSVLIGRAAMFDMITVFTCFVAIITGLFLTLLLLAIFRKALPALPLSIFLGLIFYFLTRVSLLPYVIAHGKHMIVP